MGGATAAILVPKRSYSVHSVRISFGKEVEVYYDLGRVAGGGSRWSVTCLSVHGNRGKISTERP